MPLDFFKHAFENNVRGLEVVLREAGEGYNIDSAFNPPTPDPGSLKFFGRIAASTLLAPVRVVGEAIGDALFAGSPDIETSKKMLRELYSHQINSYYRGEVDLLGQISVFLSQEKLTALHLCAINSPVEAAIYLIRAGADVNRRGQRGLTFLELGSEEFVHRCEETISAVNSSKKSSSSRTTTVTESGSYLPVASAAAGTSHEAPYERYSADYRAAGETYSKAKIQSLSGNTVEACGLFDSAKTQYKRLLKSAFFTDSTDRSKAEKRVAKIAEGKYSPSVLLRK